PNRAQRAATVIFRAIFEAVTSTVAVLLDVAVSDFRYVPLYRRFFPIREFVEAPEFVVRERTEPPNGLLGAIHFKPNMAEYVHRNREHRFIRISVSQGELRQ